MSDLSQRATTLYNSLNEFKATDRVGTSVGEMYDAVLALAQKELPDDPLISRLKPSRRAAGSGTPLDTAGDMRAVLDQILAALGEAGPAIG